MTADGPRNLFELNMAIATGYWPEPATNAVKIQDSRIEVATAAYVAVWESWRGLDARSVATCRRAAMAAAIAAADLKP